MKKLLNRENLLIVFVLGLIAHNIFLQTKVEQAIDAAQDAKYAANRAESSADNASSYASSASDYAREAARYADDASSYAYNAYQNSFGRQCWSCP